MTEQAFYNSFMNVYYRLTAFFLTAVYLLLPARPAAVALTVTQEDTQIVVTYRNNTHRGIEVGGEHFMLEKEVDGQWEALPFKEGFGFREIGCTLVPSDGGTFVIRPERTFDEPLAPGRYRLTFYYNCPADMLYIGDEYTATAEFDLT